MLGDDPSVLFFGSSHWQHVTAYARCKYLILLDCDGVPSEQYDCYAASNCDR